MLKEMLNNKTTLKTFIIEDQSTQFSQVALFPVDFSKPTLDLCDLFNSKIPNYRHCSLRIYDFSTNQYISLQQVASSDWKVPVSFIRACISVVLIKYKIYDSEAGSSFRQTLSESQGKKSISQTSSLKKQRAKQRVISEVVQIVKKWRDLHLQKRGEKKISLLQAAKMVGLPKKSLDDYYYQLRLGEKYGFDFKTYFYDGIGCLRNFLKEKKPRLKSEHNDKHPKNLKIIEDYDQIRMNTENLKIEEEQIFQEMQPKQFEEEKMIFDDEEQSVEIKLENQFYQDFGFMDFQQDPFLSMDGNFKKKKQENLFDQQLFF